MSEQVHITDVSIGEADGLAVGTGGDVSFIIPREWIPAVFRALMEQAGGVEVEVKGNPSMTHTSYIREAGQAGAHIRFPTDEWKRHMLIPLEAPE